MKKSYLLLALGLFTFPAYGVYYKTPYFPRHQNCCHFFMEFQGGDYRFNAPGFSFGEVVDPLTGVGITNISELSFDRDTVDMCFTKLNIGLEFNKGCCPCWVRNFIFELGIFYASRDLNCTPGDGVFSQFALPNITGGGDFLSSTDLLALPTSFSGVDLRRKYRYGGMQAKVGSDLNLRSCINLTPFVEFDVDSVTQDYKVDIGSIVGPAIATNFFLDEHLSTNYFDFGVGFDVNVPFSPSCNTFVLFGEAAIFMSCGHTRFHAEETAQRFLPLPITFLTSTLDKELDVLSAKARAQLGFGYQFGYNFMASLIGQVDYWGYVPRVKNPHRLATAPLLGAGIYDRPAHIEKTTAVNYALILSLTVTFF